MASESYGWLKMSHGSRIFTLEISKHRETEWIFPLESQLSHIYQHTPGWNGEVHPQEFPLGDAGAPAPTLQVLLSSYLFSFLVLASFYKSSSLTLANHSNVLNVYLFVGMQSYKMFCCSVHIL